MEKLDSLIQLSDINSHKYWTQNIHTQYIYDMNSFYFLVHYDNEDDVLPYG